MSEGNWGWVIFCSFLLIAGAIRAAFVLVWAHMEAKANKERDQ